MAERVSETATVLHKLRKSLKIQDSQNIRFEKFDRQRTLVVIVIDYIMRLYSMDDLPVDHVFGDLLKYVTKSPDLFEVTSDLFEDILCVLEGFFSFPKEQMSKIAPTPSPNEAVAVFIDFLLQISEEILHTESDFIVSVKGSIEILRTELAFLITFLGDTPMHLQPTEVEETHNVLTDMEAVVNEVGSFLYSFFFTQDAQVLVTRNLDLALSDLLPKFELLKTKIKNHCITFLKIPSCVTPNTAVFSLFIVDSLLDDLKDLMNHKADMIVGVSDQIRAVHEELIFLRSSLTDREFQDHPELRELVIPTSDIAYEVEYIINSFPPVWYLSIRLPQVLEKIKLIRMALEKMKNQYTGIQKVAEYPNGQVSLQAEKPPILDDIVVGFEDHIMEITEKLVRGPEYLQIISIFGMPGVGKTSLARKLYNDPSVAYHFHKRAWCVVSQTHRMRVMLIDILRSISNLHRDEILKIEDDKLDEYLVGNVYKGLKGRRYLIIMDDIWYINAWDDLSMYFPDDRNGSRILFTTRHRQVGLNASGRSVIHELTLLSKNQCWDLLQRKVFHNEDCPPQLVDVGKQIAEKCDGLPIAVVVIAAVLAKMEKKRSLWLNVVGSLSSHISQDPSMCMNILELSYKNLPIHLKPCFLYFGVFQEDKEIPVQKLIELWVAEGFIKREEEKSSEDVAYKYLMDLIDWSLVLVTKRRYDGRVKACIVHDLLRDMCLRIGGEENFQKVIGNQLSIYHQHHRLSINRSSIPSYSTMFGLHVRSVLGRLDDPPQSSFSSLKILRVVDMSANGVHFHHLTGVEHLVNLRFMAAPQPGKSILRMLSIGRLRKLEFLYVANLWEVQIPEILLNMVNLRHLHFRRYAQFSKFCRQRATQEENFPTNNLQSFCHLCICDKKDEKILRCSPNLRKLRCQFREFRDSSPPYSHIISLDFLYQLESLHLSSYNKYWTDLFPGSISLPMNLKKLSLLDFPVSWNQMRIIGRLPHLEVFKLLSASFEGGKWESNADEFQQLKFLQLVRVDISQWNESSVHFPRLQRLVLKYCNKLVMIPSSFGDILSLQMIQVYECKKSVVESAEEILEEQRDMGNDELKVIFFE